MSAPAFPLDQQEIAAFIRSALEEDVGAGDITAERVIPSGRLAHGTIVAREGIVCAGLALLEAVFTQLDLACRVALKAHDGDRVAAGVPLAHVSGPARALLTGERTALNILQHLSGIAVLTRSYVDAVAGTDTRILDTRKTIPLLRRLEKYAVACGGGTNHRMGLFDAVMIKDNHIAARGSITAAVAAAKAAGTEPVQVECDRLDQVDEALAAGAGSLLLDNMDLASLRRAVERAGGRVPLEASGGVTLETVRAIAATGVDFVSVGRLTQSAPAADIALDFEEI